MKRGRPKIGRKRQPIYVDFGEDRRIQSALKRYLTSQLTPVGKGPAVARLAAERLKDLYPQLFNE